jgi:hypothetical protein
MPPHRAVDASKADSPHPLIAWHEAKTKPAELNSIRRLQIDAAEGIFRSFSVAPKAWVCKPPRSLLLIEDPNAQRHMLRLGPADK